MENGYIILIIYFNNNETKKIKFNIKYLNLRCLYFFEIYKPF